MYSNIDVNISLNCYKLKKDVAFWVQYITSHDIKFIINCYCYLAWLIYWMGGGGAKGRRSVDRLDSSSGSKDKTLVGAQGAKPSKAPRFWGFSKQILIYYSCIWNMIKSMNNNKKQFCKSTIFQEISSRPLPLSIRQCIRS